MGGKPSKLNCSSRKKKSGTNSQINPYQYKQKNRRRSSASFRDSLKRLLSDTPSRKRNFENCYTLSSSKRNIEFVHGPPERLPDHHGDLIGPADFEFRTLLGQGGFGAVFKARRKSTGIDYALKVQPIESLCRSARTSRNTREDETIIQMERTVFISCRGHPFITSIEYAFHTDKYAVLGLEYVPGGTLSTCIEKSPEGYLPFPLCKTYAIEMASALNFIHSKGVIYRDLKPSNVLITLRGHLKLTDFGLAGSTRIKMTESMSDGPLDSSLVARLMGVKLDEITASTDIDHTSEGANTTYHGGSRSHSRRGSTTTARSAALDSLASNKSEQRSKLRRIKRRTVCGTSGYRAPEQVRERFLNYYSRDGYDERADWFSLGVCCYIMITGLRPFPSKKEMKEVDPNRRMIDVGKLHNNIDKKTMKLMMNDAEYQCLMVEVPFPNDIFYEDPQAESFVSALLSRDPQHRLKYDDITRHPWMEGEDFDLKNILGRPIPHWVREHTQQQSVRTLEKEKQQLSRRRKTLSKCIDSMCSDIYEKKSTSYADSFTQKWTNKARKRSINLFEHWNYMSEGVFQLEVKAAKKTLSRSLSQRLSAALSPNSRKRKRSLSSKKPLSQRLSFVFSPPKRRKRNLSLRIPKD